MFGVLASVQPVVKVALQTGWQFTVMNLSQVGSFLVLPSVCLVGVVWARDAAFASVLASPSGAFAGAFFDFTA